jgi:hypothetical protein
MAEVQSCFICDGVYVHRLGIQKCPDTENLINEGLAMFSPIGRFIRPDGTDLPSLKAIGIGGLAKFLQDELQAFATHYSQTASLQYDGHDLLSHRVYDIPSKPCCPPSRFQSAPPTFSSIRTPSESIQDTVQRFVQVGLPSVKPFFYQEKPKKPWNVHRTQSESRSNVFFGVSNSIVVRTRSPGARHVAILGILSKLNQLGHSVTHGANDPSCLNHVICPKQCCSSHVLLGVLQCTYCCLCHT